MQILLRDRQSQTMTSPSDLCNAELEEARIDPQRYWRENGPEREDEADEDSAEWTGVV